MERIKFEVTKSPKARYNVSMTLSELRKNESFKCIQFEKVDFDDCLTKEIIDLFSDDTRTWKELEFLYCRGHVDAILMMALKMNNVESLKLYYPECTFSPILGLGSMLKINTSLTSLILDIRTMGIAEATALASGLGYNKTLKDIVLDFSLLHPMDTPPDQVSRELAKGFKLNKSLESVCIDIMGIDTSCLIEAFEEPRCLRNLNVQFVSSAEVLTGLFYSTQAKLDSLTFTLDADDTMPLDLIGAIENHESIVSLDLGDCVDDSSAARLATLLRKDSKLALKELNLGACMLSDIGVTAIASALSQNSILKKLVLRVNYFEDPGARALGDALSENSCLLELDLSENNFTDAFMQVLANALRKNSTLQVLNILSEDDDERDRITDNGIRLIADALEENSTLRDLDVSGNSISHVGAAALARALLMNSGLYRLTMCGNPINFEGIVSIASALGSNNNNNSTLRAIVLSNPNIPGDEEMQKLESEIVKENFQLECLELCDGNYSYPREEFLHTLDCNRGGRKILHDRNFPLTLWPFVLERAQTLLYYHGNTCAESEKPQLSVLFSLLRDGPRLFSRRRLEAVDDPTSACQERQKDKKRKNMTC
jgi:hypothetical protein